MSLDELRGACLSQRKLYEDPAFPAAASSINPDSDSPEDWLWKRPRDICASPRLINDGATRFDIVQGELGDCWFVSAAALLATKPILFNRVVPNDQSFIRKYAGAFLFFFWRFGVWTEVIIDDRLPVTVDGELRFARNREEPDEFWAPLLEKAYAKLHGSYSALCTGYMRDALVDFTGGLSESYRMRGEEEISPDLFEIVQNSFCMGSLMGAGIWADSGATTEEELWNGLYRGHAYSITAITECRVQGWLIKLVRLRNPWGQKEWTGAWSDGSEEWKELTDDERDDMGMTVRDEGEFWMTFEDLTKNFSLLEIVHLGPATYVHTTEPAHKIWHEVSYHGRWVDGVNAGGSGLFSTSKDKYFSNPQYFVKLETADTDTVVEAAGIQECTCIVSLLQKDYRRRKSTPGMRRLIIRFDVHQVRSGEAEAMQDESFYDKTKLKKQFTERTALREITCRLDLSPALYVIIPNTLKPHQEADFLLRVFTFHYAHSQVIEERTGLLPLSLEYPVPVKPVGILSSDLFWRYAEDDLVVDARELRDLLNELGRKELGGSTTFCVEACRSLTAMFDKKGTGTLDFVQTGNLWDEILFWQKLFHSFDKDNSECIETHELRNIFHRIGYSLSFSCHAMLAVRYGGKERTLFFEDFVLLMAKTLTQINLFDKYCKEGSKKAELNLEEWIRASLMY